MTTYTATFVREPVTGGSDDIPSSVLFDTDSPRAFAEWLLEVNQEAAYWAKKWNANCKITVTKTETVETGEYHLGSDTVVWEDNTNA